jgi:acetolactate synthase-1/2/3 large subunit
MARAFRVATSGRPGPVVLALPEDMLTDRVAVADPAPYAPTAAGITPQAVDAIAAALRTAEKPLLLVGGSGWSDAASAAIQHFAEANRIPAACSFRRNDIIANLSPAYAGDFSTSASPALYRRLAEADLLLVIGARLGEITTRTYEALTPPDPGIRLVHVHPDPDEIGRVYAPELGFACAPAVAAAALDGVDLGKAAEWGAWCAAAHEDYLADSAMPDDAGWALDLGAALAEVRDGLPADTVVTVDAGNHTGWAHRFLRFGRPGRLLGATCGAMGYSVPAAVAASLMRPERLVLSFVGDGGFMMSGNELATAAQYGARPVVLLVNNGIYGTIRMHQEREHPERVSGTTLRNQDFCRMAEGLGCYAERVTRTADFAAALARARDSGRPAVLELVTDPEQISSRTTITALRRAAKARQQAESAGSH